MSRFFEVLPTREDRIANSDYHMTLDEIGQELGITRERVRQIQNAALDKLRIRFPATLLLMRELAMELRKRRDYDSYAVIR